MGSKFTDALASEIITMRENGTYKTERVLQSVQGREIKVSGKKYLNFCANNYLGF